MITRLYDYELEGMSYYRYKVLYDRAQREQHPHIQWIDSHIKFYHCYYCNVPTLASLFTTKAIINLRKHQKNAHPLKYLWDWINDVAPKSI